MWRGAGGRSHWCAAACGGAPFHSPPMISLIRSIGPCGSVMGGYLVTSGCGQLLPEGFTSETRPWFRKEVTAGPNGTV